MKLKELKEIDYDAWVKEFKPKLHKGQFMYETYGSEVAEVMATNAKHPDRVWTFVQGDDEDCFIVEGFHFVNRLGYYITRKSFDTNYNYQIPY
jgi:hypothetical protein